MKIKHLSQKAGMTVGIVLVGVATGGGCNPEPAEQTLRQSPNLGKKIGTGLTGGGGGGYVGCKATDSC